jgi:ureidoglycolate lyase
MTLWSSAAPLSAAEVARDPSTLPLRPLGAGAFAPFGEVFTLDALPPVSVNAGRGTRRDLPRTASGSDLRDTVAVYDIAPSVLPFKVTLVERHPLTAQMFMPLQASRWLVVVMPASADGGPDAAAACAFLAGPGQGIVYAPGAWHLPLVALDGPGRFLMRMGESGSPDDCHEHVLASALHVVG